jgi:hypothetical protein
MCVNANKIYHLFAVINTILCVLKGSAFYGDYLSPMLS